MSLTTSLVELIRSKRVEDHDLTVASYFVLDTLASVIGGRRSPPGRMLLEWFDEVGTDTGRCAFLAAGLGHILEIDDLHRDSVTHPGCVVIPLAWLLAGRAGLDGAKFLTAVLHGYEAMTRVGMSVGPMHYETWHNTSTCGPFGSAMAAATLLGLDEAQTVSALGNAGTQACGLWQFLPDGAMSKHLHTARAAEAGYAAASLAAHGFTGPARILEGNRGFFRALCPDPTPEALLGRPDASWQLRLTSMKPWPCCRHTHPAIDAALELREMLDGREPASVRVATYRAALDVCDRRSPSSLYAAKFSLQYCVAVALSDGRVGFDSFDDARRERAAASARDVELVASAEFDEAYPRRWGAAVQATLASGEVLRAVRRDCKGDPEAPLAREEVAEKARVLLEFGGHTGDPETLIEQILALPRADKMPLFPLPVAA